MKKMNLILGLTILFSAGLESAMAQQQQQRQRQSEMSDWEAVSPDAIIELKDNQYLISAWTPCDPAGFARVKTSTKIVGCKRIGNEVVGQVLFYYRAKESRAQCCGGQDEYAFEKRLNFLKACGGLKPTSISFVDENGEELERQKVEKIKHPHLIRNYSILRAPLGINRICSQVLATQKVVLPGGDILLNNPTELMGRCMDLAEDQGIIYHRNSDTQFGFGYASGDQVCQAMGYKYSKNVKMGCIEDRSYGDQTYITPLSIVNMILFPEGKKRCSNNVITEVTCTNIEPPEHE